MSNPMKKQRQESDNLQGPSVARFADQIMDLWRQSNAGSFKDTLELACTICKIRGLLPPGAWTKLWGWYTMPFSKRKGEMLVGIGRGLEWARAQTSAHLNLPKGWNTLYYLARLERQLLEDLIKEGKVHPALTLREARELVALHKGQPVSKDPKDSDFRKRVEHLCKCVRANMENAEAEYAWARGKLLSLAEQMEVAAGVRFVPTNIQGDLGLGDFE